MENRVLRLGGKLTLERGKLQQLDLGEIPAVGFGNRKDLLAAFRERDVEHLLACLGSFHEELQRESRLARAGLALHEVEPAFRKAAIEDDVESFDAEPAAG